MVQFDGIPNRWAWRCTSSHSSPESFLLAIAARATIANKKLSGEEWLEVHRQAHRLGIPSNCTMLYGHVETTAERVDHLLALRGLQEETGGFLTYIPLAYHPDHNELGEALGRT